MGIFACPSWPCPCPLPPVSFIPASPSHPCLPMSSFLPTPLLPAPFNSCLCPLPFPCLLVPSILPYIFAHTTPPLSISSHGAWPWGEREEGEHVPPPLQVAREQAGFTLCLCSCLIRKRWYIHDQMMVDIGGLPLRLAEQRCCPKKGGALTCPLAGKHTAASWPRQHAPCCGGGEEKAEGTCGIDNVVCWQCLAHGVTFPVCGVCSIGGGTARAAASVAGAS